jgi:hypothetical protein
MKLNKEWHKAHPMPAKPTEAQRLAWHVEHAKNCACHKMPAKLADKLQKGSSTPLLLLPHTEE